MRINRALWVFALLSTGVNHTLAEGSSKRQEQASFQVIVTGLPLSTVCATQPVIHRAGVVSVFCLSNTVPNVSVPGRADVFTSNGGLFGEVSLRGLSPSDTDANRASNDSRSFESFILSAPDNSPPPEEIEVSF